jgi:hypothetical protein
MASLSKAAVEQGLSDSRAPCSLGHENIFEVKSRLREERRISVEVESITDELFASSRHEYVYQLSVENISDQSSLSLWIWRS